MGEMKQPTQNNLLDHLRGGDFDLLAPHLKPFSANANEILYDHGQDVSTVYFPCGPTLVSFVTPEDGGAVETTLIGREGAVGGIVSQGESPAIQKSWCSWRRFPDLPIALLDEAKSASRSLDNLFARYADCTMAQIFQSTACNAAHGIEQRTAKWILAAVDRTGDDEVPLTQERLAAMLGVGRSYISRVIGRFKEKKILNVKRGYLIIADRRRLARKILFLQRRRENAFRYGSQGGLSGRERWQLMDRVVLLITLRPEEL